MSTFQMIKTTDELDQFINQNELAFLYISRPNCSVCHSLLPQIEKIIQSYPHIALGHISVDQSPEVAGGFSIFTVPVLLLFVDGKEYLREARNVHLDVFEERLKKIYQGLNNESYYI